MYFYKASKFVASPFFRYSITGGIGFVTNIALFIFFIKFLNLSATLSAFISYFCAAIQNYLINFYWTFKETTGKSNPYFYRGVKFTITSGIGIGLNLMALSVLVKLSVEVITAQIVALIISFFANYLMAKFFVYR